MAAAAVGVVSSIAVGPLDKLLDLAVHSTALGHEGLHGFHWLLSYRREGGVEGQARVAKEDGEEW